jgi:uncharacterized protein
MLFMAICKDKPNSIELRLATRPTHLAWLQGLGAKVRVGGAMLTPDMKAPTASVLIYEGESEGEIVALCAEDPYAKAGLFESVTVAPYRQAVGIPLA